MKFVIQRVTSASVTIDGNVVGSINKGFLVFVGINNTDTKSIADKMLHKLIGLRIFEDENGKTNKNLESVNGSLLIVSQFTLYADCRHGNRPSFIDAGSPDHANHLYEYLLKQAASFVPDVQHGEFGADMKVQLMNDGPFTILLDSSELGYES